MAELLPDEVVARLRWSESDRFLSALFAPPPARAGLLALAALDWELKRIPALVSEPMLGAIRYQWWRDTIGGIYAGTTPAHEIGPALAQAIEAGDLPPQAFHGWIDARERELDEVPFATLAGLEAAVGDADGAAMELAARVATGGRDVPGARDAGTAWGMVALLRRVQAAAGIGICLLPEETLRAHAAAPGDVLAGRMSAGVGAAVAALAGRASARAKTLPRKPANRAALPALMPAALLNVELRHLRRHEADFFRADLSVPAFRRQLRLLAVALTGRLR